jgi:hypothetical protein
MIDIIEWVPSPCTMIEPLPVFMSPLLMVWGGFWLVITVCLRVAIIIGYQGCGVWVFAALWEILFQLAVSPFNWVYKVMETGGEGGAGAEYKSIT